MHFFTCFPDAWLTGTADLTTEESGAYWNLCCFYIAKDGVVPDDARLLARVVKLSLRRWGLVRQRLVEGGFIDVSEGYIRQAKCDERLKIDGKFAKNQRDKIEKRWSLHRAKLLKDNNSADTPVDTAVYTTTATAPKEAEESRSKSPLFPETSQPPHTQSPGRVNGSGREDAANRFEEFWQVYPRREGANPKGPAATKFAAAVERGVDPVAIILGAKNYAAEVERQGKAGTQFVAQAVTWLNQKRWADHQTASQSNGPPKAGWL